MLNCPSKFGNPCFLQALLEGETVIEDDAEATLGDVVDAIGEEGEDETQEDETREQSSSPVSSPKKPNAVAHKQAKKAPITPASHKKPGKRIIYTIGLSSR